MMSMGTGICLPGQKRYVYTFMTGPIVRVRAGMLSADLGLSRSTVKRALNDLVRLGRVEKQPRYRENGGQTSNLYRLRK